MMKQTWMSLATGPSGANDPTWVDKWGLLVAVLLAVMGIISLIVGFLQVNRARDAVKEAKTANELSSKALETAYAQVEFARQSVEIAQAQADFGKESVEIAREQNQFTAESVAVAREQSEFAKQAVEEARAQSITAERSVEEARRQSEYAAGQLELARELRNDQVQPYVLVELDLSLRESQLLVVRVSNAGISAAHNVQVTIEPPLIMSDGDEVPLIRLSTLAPAGIWERAIDVAASYFKKDRPRRFRVSIEGQGVGGPLTVNPYEIDLDQLAPKLAIDSEGVLIVKALRGIEKKLTGSK
jgi:hypothetical protein